MASGQLRRPAGRWISSLARAQSGRARPRTARSPALSVHSPTNQVSSGLMSDSAKNMKNETISRADRRIHPARQKSKKGSNDAMYDIVQCATIERPIAMYSLAHESRKTLWLVAPYPEAKKDFFLPAVSHVIVQLYIFRCSSKEVESLSNLTFFLLSFEVYNEKSV